MNEKTLHEKLNDIIKRLENFYAWVEKVQILVEDLRDPEPCLFDHHGNCQTHGWIRGEGSDRSCPQERIKQLLDNKNKYEI